MSKNDSLPRRTLEELIQIHRLEPAIANLVVEGPSDQDLFDWFLSKAGVSAVVYPIESFDVDPGYVLSLELDDNNRGRVIALARMLSERLPQAARCHCVVDKDVDEYIEHSHEYPRLSRTDFTCMEMYTYDPSVLGKFFTLQVRRLKATADDVLNAMTPALVDLFILRLASRRRAWTISMIEWHRLLKLTGNIVALDFVTFTTRCLTKSGMTAIAKEFDDEIARVRMLIGEERREFIHGHDFTTMLAWYLRQHKGCGRLNVDELQRALYTAVEFEEIRQTSLFQEVLEALRTQQPA
jgi:hypothetical protein